MQCKKVTATRDQLLNPAAAEWSKIAGEALKMDATPLANQPSEYIKASRDAKQIGKVKNLMVQAVHNGTDVFFRLTWEDASKNLEITDNNVFPDGCGILMPLNGGDPPIDEMGSREAPVNAWFWRADLKDVPHNTVARGSAPRCSRRNASFRQNRSGARGVGGGLRTPARRGRGQGGIGATGAGQGGQDRLCGVGGQQRRACRPQVVFERVARVDIGSVSEPSG